MKAISEINTRVALIVAITVSIGCAVLLVGWFVWMHPQASGKKVVAKSSSEEVSDFVGDANHPASGTTTIDFTMKDGKLVAGPSMVSVSADQYVLFHPKAFGSAKTEYGFYIDDYGQFEVDVYDGVGWYSGNAYFRATKVGSFTYGIEDEASGNKTPLGKVVVK